MLSKSACDLVPELRQDCKDAVADIKCTDLCLVTTTEVRFEAINVSGCVPSESQAFHRLSDYDIPDNEM